MTFLEFIRKNLIIAVIVIVGILVGLLFMDYGDQGSAFSRDYRVEVNGTRYKAQDVMTLGYKTQSYLARLNRLSSPSFDNFLMQLCDADGNGELDARESVMFTLQRAAALPTQASLKPAHLLNSWGNLGVLEGEENLAVNRLLLQEAGKELGIVPSKEQIDAYIKAMPAFNNNGSFNSEAYKNLVGYSNGQVDGAGERDLRDLVADMIIWDTLNSIITANMEGNLEAEKKVDQAVDQSLCGWTATFSLANAPAPEAPTAEAVKSYWESTKDNYKSDEKRSFTIIQLIASEGMNAESMNYRAAEVQEALVAASATDPEAVISAANASEDVLPIDYKLIACEECTAETAPEILNTIIKIGSRECALREAAFNESLTATGAGRYSSYFPDTEGNTVYVVRVESIVPAATLPFEQAEPQARVALTEALKLDNFYKVADDLHKKISDELAAGKDMKSAFEAAQTAGAQVEEFTDSHIREISGKQEPGLELSEAGVEKQRLHESALRRTATGKLAPIVKSGEQAVITGITKRTTVEDNSNSNHSLRTLQLHDELMKEWLRNAYTRYKVIVPQKNQ